MICSGNREANITGFPGGDRNTQFFHSWASPRRKVNFIASIQDVTGVVWTKPEDINRVFINYYQDLFATSHPSGIEETIGDVHPRVMAKMNFL